MSSSLSGLGPRVIPQPSAPFDPAVAPLSGDRILKLNRDLFNWADKEDHQLEAVDVQASIIAAVRANPSIKAIELVFPGEPHKLTSLLLEFNIHATVVRTEAERAPPSYHQPAPDELPVYQDEFQPPQEPAARPGYEAEMARRASLGDAQAVVPPVAEAPQEIAPNAILDAMAPLDHAAPFEALQRSVFSPYSSEYVAGLRDEFRSAMQWLSDPAVSDMVKLRELSVLVSSLACHGPSQHPHVDSAIGSIFGSLKARLHLLIKPGQAPWVSEMTPTIEAWFQGFRSRMESRLEHNAEGEPQPPENAAPSAPWVAPNAIVGAAAQPVSLEASVKALDRRFAATHSPLHVKLLDEELEQVLSGLSGPAVPDDKKLEHLPALVRGLGRHVHPTHGDLESASVVARFFITVLNKAWLGPLPAMISGMKAYCAAVQSRHEAKLERDQNAALEAQRQKAMHTPDANGVTPSQTKEYYLLWKEVNECGAMFKTGKAANAENVTRIRNLIDSISRWDCPRLQLSALNSLSDLMCRRPDNNPNDSARAAQGHWPILLVAAQNIRPLPTNENDLLKASVIQRLTARHSYI